MTVQNNIFFLNLTHKQKIILDNCSGINTGGSRQFLKILLEKTGEITRLKGLLFCEKLGCKEILVIRTNNPFLTTI